MAAVRVDGVVLGVVFCLLFKYGAKLQFPTLGSELCGPDTNASFQHAMQV